MVSTVLPMLRVGWVSGGFCLGACHEVPHPFQIDASRVSPGYHHASSTPADPDVPAVAASAPAASASAGLPGARAHA